MDKAKINLAGADVNLGTCTAGWLILLEALGVSMDRENHAHTVTFDNSPLFRIIYLHNRSLQMLRSGRYATLNRFQNDTIQIVWSAIRAEEELPFVPENRKIWAKSLVQSTCTYAGLMVDRFVKEKIWERVQSSLASRVER